MRRMSRGSIAGSGLYVLAVLLACKQGGEKDEKSTDDPKGQEVPREVSSARPSANTKETAAPTPKPPKPPPSTVACKASAPGKPAVLGTRTDTIHHIQAWGDRVYVLAYHSTAARTTLGYFNRDAASKGEVGRHVGLGEPKSFRLTETHGYFLQKSALWRFPLAGGSAEKVSERFGKVATVFGEHAYGVRCADDQRDQVVRIPLTGGKAEAVGSIMREKNKCHYGDIAVDGDTAFVTDWEGRRALSVALESGEAKVLATGPAFASTLFLHKENVDFSADGGLHRVPRAGGGAKQLAEAGDSPFSHVSFDGDEYWIFQAHPYETKEHILRLGLTGGEPQPVFTFFVKDVTTGSGVNGITVDDQCFYYAKQADSYVTIYAQRKPD